MPTTARSTPSTPWHWRSPWQNRTIPSSTWFASKRSTTCRNSSRKSGKRRERLPADFTLSCSAHAPWPSSTALGDYGFLQVLNFLLLGISVLALAFALFRLLAVRRKVGPSLLVIAGTAAVCSAFKTDYATVRGDSPDTWNGVVHVIAFFSLAVAMLASMFVLASQFRRDERWRSLSRYSMIGAVIALASIIANFASAGTLFFYVFLAVILSWLTFVAAHALSLAREPA